MSFVARYNVPAAAHALRVLREIRERFETVAAAPRTPAQRCRVQAPRPQSGGTARAYVFAEGVRHASPVRRSLRCLPPPAAPTRAALLRHPCRVSRSRLRCLPLLRWRYACAKYVRRQRRREFSPVVASAGRGGREARRRGIWLSVIYW